MRDAPFSHLATVISVIAGNGLLATGCTLLVGTSGLTGGSLVDTVAGTDAGSPGSDANSDDASLGAETDPGQDTGAMLEAEAQDAADADATYDAGSPETGAADTGQADTGAVDTGAVDTGAVDTGGAVDSSPADAGPPVTTTDLAPTRDTYVQDTPYADTNFATSTQLIVKSRSTSGFNRNSWLSFDITGYTSIQSAKLRMFISSLESTATDPIPVVLYYAPDSADAWQEASLTWNSAPAAGSDILGTITVDDPQIGTWIEYDATAAVSSDQNGVSTFMLTSTPATNRGCMFSSTRGSNPPVLRITGVHP